MLQLNGRIDIAETAVKAVIDVLLCSDSKNFSLNELDALHFDATKFMAVVIIAAGLKEREITDYAIEKCLEVYEKEKKKFMSLVTNPCLETATRLLPYNPSKAMAEKVIVAVAEQGWYGRIESLAKRYLVRGLTADEVMALVEHFMKQRGMISGYEEILQLAKKYMPEDKFDEVASRMGAHVKAFNEDTLY